MHASALGSGIHTKTVIMIQGRLKVNRERVKEKQIDVIY